MIDWDRVEDLVSDVGGDDFNEVVDLFLEEVDEVIERLKSAPTPATYEADLHFLKGSALSLGFRKLSVLCHQGERRSAEGKADQVDIGQIISIYEAARTEFLAGLIQTGRKDSAA